MELFALTVAGFIAFGITQLTKAGVKLSGRAAVITSLVMSTCVAGISGVLTGEVTTPEQLVVKASIVFAVATLTYKLIYPAFTSEK